jgi:hypothetical protein
VSEHDQQKALIDWCFYHLAQYPELDLIHAIPNGAMLGGGRVGAMRMNILKAEGLRPGVCDLFLPVARGGYFGLYIEMKDFTGKLSENQKEFISAVEDQGYMCCVPYGAEEAQKNLQTYLDYPKTKVVKKVTK